MRLFVGVTDFDWYSQLSARPDIDEVNFWSPGGAAFKVLQPGELFLFKLKAAHGHMIVGGGIFAHDTLLPLSMAWLVFGEKNGVASLHEMRTRIRQYRSESSRNERDPAMVLRDVRNELVSLAAALADYGVVLAENPLAVDEAATRTLRERLRRARNWPQTPAISWEPPDTAMAAE